MLLVDPCWVFYGPWSPAWSVRCTTSLWTKNRYSKTIPNPLRSWLVIIHCALSSFCCPGFWSIISWPSSLTGQSANVLLIPVFSLSVFRFSGNGYSANNFFICGLSQIFRKAPDSHPWQLIPWEAYKLPDPVIGQFLFHFPPYPALPVSQTLVCL